MIKETIFIGYSIVNGSSGGNLNKKSEEITPFLRWKIFNTVIHNHLVDVQTRFSGVAGS